MALAMVYGVKDVLVHILPNILQFFKFPFEENLSMKIEGYL